MNNNFLLKLISEELSETLFFATGCLVKKVKTTTGITLTAGKVLLELISQNNINVNGVKFKSSVAARRQIQLITI